MTSTPWLKFQMLFPTERGIEVTPRLPSKSQPPIHLETLCQRNFPGREWRRSWSLRRGGKIALRFIMALRCPSRMSALFCDGRKGPQCRRRRRGMLRQRCSPILCTPHTLTCKHSAAPYRERTVPMCDNFFSNYKHMPFEAL